MCEYKGFYDMVKRWTVNDFCTPGLKAEVIIDMLLSEFIEEIVCYGLQGKEGKGNLERKNFHLVAKEFPILKQPDKDNRNYKVDYLIKDDSRETETETFYLVELKTTNESFSDQQMNVYKRKLKFSGEESEDSSKKTLIEGFCKIIESCVYDEDLSLNKPPVEIKGSKKYATIVRSIKDTEEKSGEYKSIGDAQEKNEECGNSAETKSSKSRKSRKEIKKLSGYLQEKYKKCKVEIVYISLENLGEIDTQHVHFIELNDDGFKERLRKGLEKEKAEKRECWNLVEKILRCLKNENFQEWRGEFGKQKSS